MAGYFLVGMQGIEPCLHAPEARVLPVYYIPNKYEFLPTYYIL